MTTAQKKVQAKTNIKTSTVPFKTIRARAEKRKGGPKALEKLLPKKPTGARSPSSPTIAFWRR